MKLSRAQSAKGQAFYNLPRWASKLLPIGELVEQSTVQSRPLIVTVLVLIVAGVSASAQSWPVTPSGNLDARGKGVAIAATPDLLIREFAFVAGNNKAVRVHLVNSGSIASERCILRLTVRKINGLPVGRIRDAIVPPLTPGKNKWFVIDASGILPQNVSLELTTFKLNADATSIVTESDEANNEVWHNL